MAFLNDSVFDNGLNWLDNNATKLNICSQEPTTYTQANATYSLGSFASLDVQAPSNGAIDGRRVVVSAITSGTVSGTGTATHWAITNGTDTLIATGSLTASQAVTAGNTFSLDAIDITIRDATSV